MNITISASQFQKDIIAKSKSTHIPGMDWEDIVQELDIHVWQNGKKFDPTKASERTFVVRIITNKIRDLARRANAKKRSTDKNAISLDELIEGGFDVSCTFYE
jgi:DNA-directed RNA polymerase specialized sigma24 family protein